MEREVTVEDKKYKIRIGYGAYNRIDALLVFVKATEPANTKTQEVKPDIPMTNEEGVAAFKENLETGSRALMSENIIEQKDVKNIVNATIGDIKLVDLLEIEQSLGEKVGDAKIRIIELAVRDVNNKPLTRDYIEAGLSPPAGEKLFALVMETFNMLKQQVEDTSIEKN